MLRDNGWYRMLRRSNVDLVRSKAISFESNAVVGERGERIPADVVVFATGFEASKMLASFSLKGRNGVSIREIWGEDDPRAYLGMAVPEFPNFFIMYGPNTNIGTGGSIILQAETWSRYIADVIRTTIEKNISVVEVKTEACDDYNQRMDDRLAGMVWAVSAAGTWYRNGKGRVTANMPWTSYEYWSMTQTVNFDDFETTPATSHAEELRPALSA
jgi:4-hydroxyacetophenone monooxygenase